MLAYTPHIIYTRAYNIHDDEKELYLKLHTMLSLILLGTYTQNNEEEKKLCAQTR